YIVPCLGRNAVCGIEGSGVQRDDRGWAGEAEWLHAARREGFGGKRNAVVARSARRGVWGEAVGDRSLGGTRPASPKPPHRARPHHRFKRALPRHSAGGSASPVTYGCCSSRSGRTRRRATTGKWSEATRASRLR